MTRQAGAVLGMLFVAHPAAAQFTEEAELLDTWGGGQQGYSVAISADGDSATSRAAKGGMS